MIDAGNCRHGLPWFRCSLCNSDSFCTSTTHTQAGDSDPTVKFRQSWDEYFLTLTILIASRSKDQNTHIGAVIVNDDNIIKATGYNSFPRGIDDDRPERQSREGGVKYAFFEHAERNAIYSAAREGVSLRGCRIYVSAMPCADCARGIIQAGIKEVIIDATWQAEMAVRGKWKNWEDSHRHANEMFSEAGVRVRAITARLIPIARYADGATF